MKGNVAIVACGVALAKWSSCSWKSQMGFLLEKKMSLMANKSGIHSPFVSLFPPVSQPVSPGSDAGQLF